MPHAARAANHREVKLVQISFDFRMIEADERRGEFGIGDVWTWTAIDADTRLIASWMVGTRDDDAARAFIGDLAPRLATGYN